TRIVRVGIDRCGQPGIPYELAVQARGRSVRQQFVDDIEHIVIGMAEAGLVEADRQGGFGVEFDLDAPLSALRRLDGDNLGRRRSGGNLSEGTFDQGQYLLST